VNTIRFGQKPFWTLGRMIFWRYTIRPVEKNEWFGLLKNWMIRAII
jgi:hypothetical protein